MDSRSLEYYRALPYERVWKSCEEDERRYFVVRLSDIPQVMGGGLTKDEAVQALRDAFDDYVTWRLDEGLPVPDPARVFTRAKIEVRKMALEVPAPQLAKVAQTISRPKVETRSRAESILGRVAA